MKALFSLLLFAPFLLSCTAADGPFPETSVETFEDYWFDKAEITRYALQQNRYGEMREGDSVLIFVTEPFLKDAQVKLESGPGENAVPTLKLNRIRSFVTGVYDYRLMASVFHPVASAPSAPADLKIAMTSTEWCGLVFQQVNRRDDALEVELRSYFQSAGDQNVKLSSVWTEDGLWTRLRIDPSSLPTGTVEIIPELFFQRLRHLEPKTYQAEANLDLGSTPATYRLHYPALDRTLTLRFEAAIPHRIHGWTETVGGELFTEATATDSKMLYYWERQAERDTFLREELGL